MRTCVALLAALLLVACAPDATTETITTTTTSTPTTTSTTVAATTTSTTLYIPVGVDATSPCLLRAGFGDPEDSLYILPFPPGKEVRISQGYCFSKGGHKNQLAYDFDLRVGDEVIAARAGVVRDIREDSPDNGVGNGEHNYVFIQHKDRSVAFYAHLQQDAVLVEPGDSVEQGQVIAYSGNSGLTGHPHLHFGVYRNWPPGEGSDIPVNFSNAVGPIDPRGGLIVWRSYEAR